MERSQNRNKLTEFQIEDLRLAASKMNGASRRAFQAEICLKYCDGKARYAETILGWDRKNVQLGLEEKRNGENIDIQMSEISPRRKDEKA